MIQRNDIIQHRPDSKTRQPHEGRAMARGMTQGILLLRDALACADLDLARGLIDMAERRRDEAMR